VSSKTKSEHSLLATLNRTFHEFQDDNLSDWAAALTYYGLLSLFPMLIALVAIVGLVADPASTTRTVTEIVTRIGPESGAQTYSGPIHSITSNRGSAGVLLVIGTATALWSASGYIGAFIRASNVIYETEEGRPFWKRRPLQLAVTLAMVVMVAAVLLALVLTGPIVRAVANPLGVGETAITIWKYSKWPVLALLFVLMIDLLYYASPNAKLRGFAWLTPGAVLALVLWGIASTGFALFVANFGSYDKTYGTLGGVVVLLIWMWITNLAILLGAELNAERERGRQMAEGVPHAEDELQLEPRQEPGDSDRQRASGER
jgi:membrane protein